MSAHCVAVENSVRNFIQNRLTSFEFQIQNIIDTLNYDNSLSSSQKRKILKLTDPLDGWTLAMTIAAYFPNYMEDYFNTLKKLYQEKSLSREDVLDIMLIQNDANNTILDLIAQAISAKKLFICTRKFLKDIELMNYLSLSAFRHSNHCVIFSSQMARLFASIFKILTKAIRNLPNAASPCRRENDLSIRL